ncbi:MAG: very short patch repair endonuclease [Chloroflexota bacterium]
MTDEPKEAIRQSTRNPSASSKAALNRMKAAKPRDTAPEKALRSALHGMGLRFRIDGKLIKELNRRVDIVFQTAKVAVFVDGCFWHGCPIHGTQARANAEFWSSKIKRNQERDLETTRLLKKAGWKVVRVWEHEDPIKASRKIFQIVSSRRIQSQSGK